MSKVSYFAIAALTASSVTIAATPAFAQATPAPSPAPTPTPSPRATPQADPSLIQRRTDDFQQEFDMRQMMRDPESYARAYSLAEDVSRCVIDKMGEKASGLVGGPMTEDEEYKELSKAMARPLRTCLRAETAGLPMLVMNSSLAEGILRTRAPALEPRAMSLNQDDIDAFTTMGPGVRINFDIIGRCAAVFSPGLTYKVLETKPGSDAEMDALNTLYRSTPECGLSEAPEGAPASYQRGVLASGLFHWLQRG